MLKTWIFCPELRQEKWKRSLVTWFFWFFRSQPIWKILRKSNWIISPGFWVERLKKNMWNHHLGNMPTFPKTNSKFAPEGSSSNHPIFRGELAVSSRECKQWIWKINELRWVFVPTHFYAQIGSNSPRIGVKIKNVSKAPPSERFGSAIFINKFLIFGVMLCILNFRGPTKSVWDAAIELQGELHCKYNFSDHTWLGNPPWDSYIYIYIIYRYIPAPSKGCQLNPKTWWIDTVQEPFGTLWKVQVHIFLIGTRYFPFWNSTATLDYTVNFRSFGSKLSWQNLFVELCGALLKKVTVISYRMLGEFCFPPGCRYISTQLFTNSLTLSLQESILKPFLTGMAKRTHRNCVWKHRLFV